MASMKRQLTISDEPNSKKAKIIEAANPSEPQKPKERVVLNPADCDLDFNVEGNGLRGSALYEEGFAYCWSGARANVGITRGKYCFSCEILSAQPVDMEDTPFDQQHLCRLGISRGDQKVGNLGETRHSFGYGGTGKISNSGNFFDYGVKFGIGDTILCAVDIYNDHMVSIGFSVNGNWLGYRNFHSLHNPIGKFPWDRAAFPHVLLKNVVVQLQFSVEDGLVPLEGYRPWASAIEDGNGVMGPTFEKTEDCEVIMMVGLPASGKTTWAEKLVKQTPEKRYVLLGTNLALDQMKVPGLQRKRNYGERFDRLMSRATGIFNTLLSRASKTPRNFIIDQTNVYKSARKRKLKPFSNYQKNAVVVFPRPEELKARAEKRFNEMGKEVPEDTVNGMIANYVLPMSKDMRGTDEYFDQIVFAELSRAEAQKYLDEMKANLHSKHVPSPYPRGNSIQSHNDHSLQNPLEYQQSLPVVGGMCPPRPHTPNPPLTATYGNQSSSSSFLPRDDFNHYRSYVGYDSRRNDIDGTISNAGGTIGPFRTYGSTNFLPMAPTGPYQSGMAEPYQKPSSFGYNAHGGVHSSFPVVPPADPLVPRHPMFQPSTQNTYGPSYGSSVPRPSYGNLPMQYDGYAPPPPPPRPWY